MSEIIIFDTAAEPVQVRLEGDTVWLMQRQMAEVFDTSTDNVGLHLINIYQAGELEESATTEDFLAVRQEGKRQVKRSLKHYNLDAIISVGYRDNFTRATRFRQWATRVLREHLTQGYTLNAHRLAGQGVAELEQVAALLVPAQAAVSPHIPQDVSQ